MHVPGKLNDGTNSQPAQGQYIIPTRTRHTTTKRGLSNAVQDAGAMQITMNGIPNLKKSRGIRAIQTYISNKEGKAHHATHEAE